MPTVASGLKLVRKADWEQAINEFKKAQLSGEDAMAAYREEKEAAAKAHDAMMPVSDVFQSVVCALNTPIVL